MSMYLAMCLSYAIIAAAIVLLWVQGRTTEAVILTMAWVRLR